MKVLIDILSLETRYVHHNISRNRSCLGVSLKGWFRIAIPAEMLMVLVDGIDFR